MGEHTKKHRMGKHRHAPPESKVVVGGTSAPAVAGQPGQGRTRLYALISAAVVLLVVGGVFAYKKYHKPAVLSVCDSAITKDAGAQYAEGNITGMSRVLVQIRARQHYTKDPNCLYIIAQYQILSADLTAAQGTIDRLKTYGAAHMYDSTWTPAVPA